MSRTTLVFICLAAVLFSSSVTGQEMIYDQPFQIDYDNPNKYNLDPVITFNGTDHAVFYAIQGPTDKDMQLYFRRLDRDGIPSSPQEMVIADEGRDWPIVACSDGKEAFLVAVTNLQQQKICVLRVARDGSLIRRVDFDEPIEYWMHGPHAGVFNGTFMQVVGDKFVLGFTDKQPTYEQQRAMLVVGPKTLKGACELTELPKGDLKNNPLIGMTYDTEGFIAMVGQRDKSDGYAFEKVLLVRISFDGKVVGEPYGLEDPVPSSIFMGGPVFFGKGFMIFYSEYKTTGYNHYSLIFDSEGNTIHGPTNLGWASVWFSWGWPIWNGDNVACLLSPGPKMRLILFSEQGSFLCEPIYYADVKYSPGFRPVEAFTGTATTIAFAGRRKGKSFHHVHVNQVSLPPSVKKPKIVYFDSGAEYLGNRRALIWSATGCDRLRITGKGVKLTTLPAIGCEIIKIKGATRKLKITARGPGGKAVKRITLKP